MDKSVLKDHEIYYNDETELYTVKTPTGERFTISPGRFSNVIVEYGKRAKSKKTAYRLCFFLGFLGIHRFYLGDKIKGALLFTTLGGLLVGWVLDFLFLGSRVDEINKQIETELLAQAIEDTKKDELLDKELGLE